MKKYLLTLCLFSVPCFVFSQISVVENDIADGGESFVISTANPLGSYDLTTSGADASWNFSSLTAMMQDTINWLDATDTNPAYFLLWFSSDVAEEFTQGISTDSFSIEDIFNFYERSSDALKQTGIAGTITGIPLPAAFTEPDVVYNFPLNYGDVDSSASSFVFDLLGFASFTENRNRVNTVDGWGEITTPVGTYDVIRIHAQIETEDIVEYSGTEIPVTYTNHEYKWMAKEMGVPVLQINTTQIAGGAETITRVAYQDTAHITDAITAPFITEDHIAIYPNPVRDHFSLSMTAGAAANYYFELTDDAGNKKYRSAAMHCTAGNNIFDFSAKQFGLSGGIYFMKLYDNDQLIAVKRLIYLP